jgi:hydrogenase nickel incorporation protein HypB
MCTVCGCSDRTATEAQASHGLRAGGGGGLARALHYGQGAARLSIPGMSQARAIQLETSVVGENDRLAQNNRDHFRSHRTLALNLVSSPGSGKTTLLCATIQALRAAQPELAIGVIEGDQQTSNDAERVRATGVPAVQVNTGKGCHLDAEMVGAAFMQLPLHAQGERADDGSILFIENVGNLVCPALWDLGERAKIAILSVTEGEDKPIKYPDMFAAARLMLINKIDLLPYVSFDVAASVAFAKRVNPAIEVLELSATRGDGIDGLVRWLLRELASTPIAAREHHAEEAVPCV